MSQVDSDTPQETLNDTPMLVVDFYADLSGLCKIVRPIMVKIAADYDGKARLVKLDLDNSPIIADEFGAMSTPTLMVFKNTKPVERTVGATTLAHYRKTTATVL